MSTTLNVVGSAEWHAPSSLSPEPEPSAEPGTGRFTVCAREAGQVEAALPIFASAADAVAFGSAPQLTRDDVEYVPGAFMLNGVLSSAECEEMVALTESDPPTTQAPTRTPPSPPEVTRAQVDGVHERHARLARPLDPPERRVRLDRRRDRAPDGGGAGAVSAATGGRRGQTDGPERALALLPLYRPTHPASHHHHHHPPDTASGLHI